MTYFLKKLHKNFNIFLNIYTVINILFIDRIKLMNIHKNIYDN